MRNFFLFLQRYANQLLFLFLALACVLLIARTNHLQGNAILNSANGIAGMVYEKQMEVTHYFRLRQMNDSLLHENEKLRNQLMLKQSYDTLLTFSQQHENIKNGSDTAKQILQTHSYTYRNARVINNSVGNENNYLTINRGTNQGVQPNMAVVSGTGVVGKVVRCSPNYAVVLSILSTIQPVSGRLKDGTTGLVKWESKKPTELVMHAIPGEIPVYIGDTIFTTQYSFFPEGVPIGKVYQVMISKKTKRKVLYLKPLTNFQGLQYVYVIEDGARAEREQLEEIVKQKK